MWSTYWPLSQANQKDWISRVVASNSALQASQEKHAAETKELREQIKDLMFHLQVTGRIVHVKCLMFNLLNGNLNFV